MSESSSHHPADIAVGDSVQIRVGGEPLMALVEDAATAGQLSLRSPEAVSGEIILRWLDASGMAWRVPAKATQADGDPTSVTVDFAGEWEQDSMRASQRVSGNRHSLRGEVLAGSLPPGARLDLVCLDISASGCRTSGVGRMPETGDVVRLCCVHPFGEDRWLLARVMRANPLSFGRYELGFRFDPETPDEKSWITGWRDAWAYVARDEDEADGPQPIAVEDEAGEDVPVEAEAAGAEAA